MCGIAGLINLKGDSISPDLIKIMTDAISHRGPDGEGYWVDKNIGFGHRRLSIIDLSDHGKQPMISENRRFIFIYNGEIYNFREIRSELESLGISFKSKTDSEVVMKALIVWGTDAFLKFKCRHCNTTILVLDLD